MFSIDAVVLGALIDFSTAVIAVIVAFVIGLLLAFLLVTPARSASNHIARDRERRIKQLDDQVKELQERNEQLREQNSSVLAERNHLRGQLDALRQHNVAAASLPNPDGYGTEPTGEQPAQVAPPQSQAQSQEQPQHESFGERIKDFFSGNNPDNTPTNTPNATT